MPSLPGQLKVAGGHGGCLATSPATSLTFAEPVIVTGAGGFLPLAFAPYSMVSVTCLAAPGITATVPASAGRGDVCAAGFAAGAPAQAIRAKAKATAPVSRSATDRRILRVTLVGRSGRPSGSGLEATAEAVRCSQALLPVAAPGGRR